MPSSFAKSILNMLFVTLLGNWLGTIRAEIEVAKIETQVKLREIGKGVALLVVAGAFAFMMLLLGLTSAVLALSKVMEPWVAAIIVGGGAFFWVVILGAWGAFKISRNKDLVPRRTIDSIKGSFTNS